MAQSTALTAPDPIATFNRYRDRIARVKAETGDWEKAYEAVTGQKWPKGKGIKINPDGTATMAKDKSIWKTIGKIASIAAPIVAAPFTGGTSLALIGAGSGAANAALNGGGVKGALLGAGIGGLTAGLMGGAKGGDSFIRNAVGDTATKALGTGATEAVKSAATSPSLWKSFINNPIAGTALEAGTNLAGTWMETRAQKQAAELEAQSLQNALDWQKEQYGVRQQQLAPSINTGNASTVQLAHLMGLNAPEGGWESTPAPTQVGSGQTPAAAAGGGGKGMVLMQAPGSSQTKLVPQAMVAAYQAKGAQVVQ